MFKSARIQLTLWYLISILFISISFSTVIYHLISREVDRFDRMQRSRMEMRMKIKANPILDQAIRKLSPPPFTNPDLIEEIKHRILIGLFLINCAISILAAFLGYMLAGRTLEPISEMVEDQRRFISDASHELKTPLTSLKAAFEVYLRDQNRTKKDADIIVKESLDETDRLSHLVESLMSLLRSGFSKDEIASKSFQLDQTIQKAIDFIQPLAQMKQITLTSSLNECSVVGDRERIRNLVLILLDNAIKYSQPHGAVEISLKKNKRHITLSVIDTGVGMNAAELPHIFDRFYRADSARSRQSSAGGYGLGLAIAKEIVTLHNGSITAKSREGLGTTMTVVLPMG